MKTELETLDRFCGNCKYYKEGTHDGYVCVNEGSIYCGEKVEVGDTCPEWVRDVEK